MKRLTQEQFLNLIRDDVEDAGSQKALAERIGVSNQYLGDVLRQRRSPGPKILAAYNVQPVTTYATKEEKK